MQRSPIVLNDVVEQSSERQLVHVQHRFGRDIISPAYVPADTIVAAGKLCLNAML